MTKSNLKVVKSTKDQEMDIKEKNKALDAAIAQITDNFGKGSVHLGVVNFICFGG